MSIAAARDILSLTSNAALALGAGYVVVIEAGAWLWKRTHHAVDAVRSPSPSLR